MHREKLKFIEFSLRHSDFLIHNNFSEFLIKAISYCSLCYCSRVYIRQSRQHFGRKQKAPTSLILNFCELLHLLLTLATETCLLNFRRKSSLSFRFLDGVQAKHCKIIIFRPSRFVFSSKSN